MWIWEEFFFKLCIRVCVVRECSIVLFLIMEFNLICSFISLFGELLFSISFFGRGDVGERMV